MDYESYREAARFVERLAIHRLGYTKMSEEDDAEINLVMHDIQNEDFPINP